MDIRKKAAEKSEIVQQRVEATKEKAQGEVKGKVAQAKTPWVKPKTRTERKFFKELVYFICSECQRELGPVSQVQWAKILNSVFSAAKVGVGIATGNPTIAIGGAAGMGKAMTSEKPADAGFLPHSQLKDLKKKREMGKTYLTQCPKCARWVCLDCWNSDSGTCVKCAQ